MSVKESSFLAPGQDIVSLIADAAFVHRDGSIVCTNAAAERAFGAGGEQSLAGASAWALIAADTAPDTAAAYRRLGTPGGPRVLRLGRQRFDGRIVACEMRGAPIGWDGAPATLVVIRDEAPAMAEGARADAGAPEFDFAEISPDAMFVHQFGRIVFVNPAACEMFRAASPEALVGRDIHDLVHPDEHAYIEGNWANIDAGPRDPLVGIRRLRLDGTVFIGEGRHKLVRWHGQQAVLVVIRDATPRLEAREVVQQREAEYRGLLDNLPDAVLAHVDGTIVYANRVAAAHFRAASPAVLVGMTMRDITHPDERAAVTDSWMASTQVPGPSDIITRRRLRLDGTSFISESRRISNDWQGAHGIVLVLRDATERLAAERELRESEARHRAIAEVCPDALLVQVDGTIVYANPAAARLFAADEPAHLTNRALGQLIPPDNRRGASGYGQQLDFGRQLPLQEIRVRDLAGRLLECETVTCGYRWNGLAASLLIVRDIGARKQGERRLIQAREDAIRANETKSRFLASMSHELRTPLNSILGFSEVIKSEMFGPAAKPEYVSYAGHIHQSGQHLLSLIDDLLDISKAEAGKYEIAETVFDLGTLTENALLLLRPLAESRRIALALARRYECFVSAGEREIHQVITNLVSNAIKFTPDGGGVEVALSATPGDGIAITVADTGIGINEADKARLFEAYSQVGDPMVKSGHKGTGLGLALSKHLIELHGGAIDIDSVEGEGTTVTVSLPAHRLRDRPPPPQTAARNVA